MDKKTLIKRATTYIKTLDGIEWNNSIKFECQSPQCRGSVTNQNSGVYMPASGRVFCWQPNCQFSKERAATGHSHDIATYLAVCNGGDVDINGRANSESYADLKDFLEYYPEDQSSYVSRLRVKWSLNEFVQIDTPDFQVPINIKSGDPKAVQYVKKRGFDPNWLWNKYKITYICRESKLGRQDYNGYILIPYFDKLGRIVFFQGRDYLFRPQKSKTNPDGIVRWLNPSERTVNVGKSDFIFNGHELDNAEELYLSEAVFDALELCKIDNPAVKGSIGGSSISDRQIAIIESAPKLKKIYVVMDGGAFGASLNIADKLLTSKKLREKEIYVVPIHMHIYPNGKKRKDANELGYDYMLGQIQNQAVLISKLKLAFLRMNLFRFGNESFMNENYLIIHNEKSEDHYQL